jgi:hypothetical protein
MAHGVVERRFPEGRSIPVTEEDRNWTASSESLFQSARRAPGGEMLGIGVAVSFFLLLGGSLLGTYRASGHQRPEPVRAATVVAPPERPELGHNIRDPGDPPPARPPRYPVQARRSGELSPLKGGPGVSPESHRGRFDPGAQPRPPPPPIERRQLPPCEGHPLHGGRNPAGAPPCSRPHEAALASISSSLAR